MPGYRCFLFGDDNHIIGRVEYKAETDALAIVEGRAVTPRTQWLLQNSASRSGRKVASSTAKIERHKVFERWFREVRVRPGSARLFQPIIP